MLRGRLFAFLSSVQETHHLSDPDIDQITRAVLLYVLGRRNAEELRIFGKDLKITEDLYQFKSEFLDRSYYTVSQFWRLAFMYFKLLPCRANGPDATLISNDILDQAFIAVPTLKPEQRKSCLEDMRILEDHLPLEDHRKIFRLARLTDFETPTDIDLYPIIKKLQKFCLSLAHRKMRFLINNDNGLSINDLATELFEAALLTLRNYDTEYKDTLKVLNFSKVGAKNHCGRLIDFYTAQRRTRLVRIIDNENAGRHAQQKCGTCAMFNVRDASGKSCEDQDIVASAVPCNMKEKGGVYHPRPITEEHACGNCSYYDKPLPGQQRSCVNINIRPYDIPCESFVSKVQKVHFVTTTTSLEVPVGNAQARAGNDGKVTTLGDMLETEHKTDDVQISENQWLDSLYEQVPADMHRIVKITLGEEDAEFESWLWQRSGKTVDELPSTSVAKLACEFASVPVDYVRQVLSSVLGARQTGRTGRMLRA